MKTEDIEKTIELLYEYHYTDELLKKSEETHATIAVLLNKIENTNNEAEQLHYRKNIADSIQKIIYSSNRDGGVFNQNVLMFWFGIATAKLEDKLKALKYKIDKL